MAIDPNSLLIFRARETEDQVDAGKKKKAAQKEQALPKEENPKRLPKFTPDKETKPMLVEQQKPAAPQPKQQPAPQQAKPQPQPIRTSPVETRPIRTSPFGNIPFKLQTDRGRTLGLSETSIYSEEEISVNREPEAFHEPPKSLIESVNPAQLKSAAIKKQQESRDAARGQTCSWHPWREAYATCGFCNRFFCFQDIIEFNRNYYCLDDIDKVSPKFVENVSSRSNNLWLVSGLLLMAAFFVFFYFANAQLIYVLQYLHKVTIFYFLASINYSYVFALLGGLFTSLALISALLLFVRSPKGFYLGVFVCLGSVALFSYQYTGTATAYLGVVDALMFLAFAVLIYSRTGYTLEEMRSPISALAKNPINWPNAGKF